MKNKLAITICLLVSILTYSQNKLQGRVFYTNSTKSISNKKIDSTVKKMKSKNPKMTKWMKDILKGGKDVVGVLEFSNGESLYKIEEVMKNDAKKTLNLTALMAGGKTKFYTNTITKDYFKQSLRDEPLRIEMPKYDWKITQESKKIGNYVCFKAIYIKEIENRNGKRKVEIVAWFTPQIPVNFGPKNYFGLPGLILELNQGKTTIIATKIELSPKEEIKIKKPSKGKRMTAEEYREMSRKFFKNIGRKRN